MTQHLVAIRYYGRFIRSIIDNLIHNHVFLIPEWDMAFGEGNDILMSLGYYVIGDPFALLSAFFSEENALYCYQLIVILKLFLSGISFILFCNYKFKTSNYDNTIILCSLLYVFNLYSLGIGVLGHPFFLTPLIYLPLLILGVDYIFDHRSPYLYIFSLFFMLISNFYFAYMLALTVLAYTIYRFIIIKSKKTIINNFIHIGISTIISFFLSAIILLPMFYFSLSDTRSSGIFTPIHLFFNTPTIAKNISSLFFMNSWDYVTFKMGLPLTIIPFLVALYINKNIKKCIIYSLILFLFFTPFFWKIMNFMSYPSYRWGFIFIFLLLFIVIKYVPVYENFDKKSKLITISLSAVVILFITLISFYVRKGFDIVLIINLLSAVITLFILLYNANNKSHLISNIVIYVLSIVLLTFNIRYLYNSADWYKDYLKFEDRKDQDLGVYASAKILKNNDNSFFRLSGNNLEWDRNGNVLHGISSTQYYWTMVNPYISKYRLFFGLFSKIPWAINDNQNMTILDTLSSVKYIADNDKKVSLPFSYNNTPIFNNSYLFYENKDPLPIIYFSDNYKLEAETLSYNIAEKQQAMLDGCIINTTDYNLIANKATPFISHAVDYNIFVPKENKDDTFIDETNNVIYVLNDNGSKVNLSYNGKDNSEFFLEFRNLRCFDYGDLKYNKPFGDLDQYKSFSVFEDDTLCRYLTYYSDYDSRGGLRNFSFNLFYKEKRKSPETITINFDNPGVYVFDDIILSYVNFDNYHNSLKNLKRLSLNKYSLENNTWSFDVTSTEDGLACINIPYSKGFSAMVDGTPTPLYNTNYKYMSLKISKGPHIITLNYSRPYQKLGAIISLIGFCLLLTLFYYNKHKVKNILQK